MKFEVDAKLVEPIIRDQIAAAVVSQLGDTTELVKRMVHLSLTAKVNSEGKIDQYSSYNKYDFIEVLAGKAIREAATQAIQKIVAEQQPAIQAAIEAELRRSPKRTASAVLSAFLDGVKSNYRITANFVFRENE